MKAIKPVKGLDWDGGAIGTAVWGGVRLKDVLEYAGGRVRSGRSQGLLPNGSARSLILGRHVR
jgi:hypothetical protein